MEGKTRKKKRKRPRRAGLEQPTCMGLILFQTMKNSFQPYFNPKTQKKKKNSKYLIKHIHGLEQPKKDLNTHTQSKTKILF
jgi:hypothetical protein